MTAPGRAAPTSALLEQLREKARLLRIHSLRMTTAAGSGHPTSCLSAAELVAATFFYAMKLDPANPTSLSSDRFVLSKGHAAPILYAALAEAGVFPVSRLMTLRQFSSELEGHPTPRVPGVDAATGSLGQGLSVGAGLAIGARIGKSSARVYVLTGDGELAEGNIWEAAAFAGHNGLDNLVALADINALGQSQHTMYEHDVEVYRRKFEAQGWAAEVIDGHDLAAVVGALDHARATRGKPFSIIARTDKGHGVSFLSGKDGWHGKALSTEQLEKALAELGPVPPVQKDTGRSYERQPLPAPPENFPAAAAPDYKLGQSVATREAFGVGLKNLAAVNPKVYAIDGDVKNSTFTETLQKTFPDRLIEGFIHVPRHSRRHRFVSQRWRFCGTVDRRDGAPRGNLLSANVSAENGGLVWRQREISRARPEGAAAKRKRSCHRDRRGSDGLRSAPGLRSTQIAPNRRSRARSLLRQASRHRCAQRTRPSDRRPARYRGGPLCGRRPGRSRRYRTGRGWRAANGGSTPGRGPRAAFRQARGVTGCLRHLRAPHRRSRQQLARREGNRSGMKIRGVNPWPRFALLRCQARRAAEAGATPTQFRTTKAFSKDSR